MIEEAVTVRVGGLELSGIHHHAAEPELNRRLGRVGVLLSDAGLTYHVGLARLYVRLSRRLARRGYDVLRFDPHGVGDSQGSLDRTVVVELFRQIETGLFVDDTLAAFDQFMAMASLDSIVMAGFCGGAVTSLLAACQRLQQMAGLVLAGPPVLIEGTPDEQTQSMTSEGAREYRALYLRKLFDLKAWIRLLSFKTNLRQLVRSFTVPFGRRKITRSLEEVLVKAPNFNRAMAESFEKVAARDIPVLFAYGEHDKERGDFEEYFKPVLLAPGSPYERSYDYRVIPDGDHNFCLPAAQEEVITALCCWIEALADRRREPRLR